MTLSAVFSDNFIEIDEEILIKIWDTNDNEKLSIMDEYRVVRSPYPAENVRTKIIGEYFIKAIHYCKKNGLSSSKSLRFLLIIQDLFRVLVFENSNDTQPQDAKVIVKEQIQKLVAQCSQEKDPLTKDEVSNMIIFITNFLLRHMMSYHFIFHENPKEFIEYYSPIVQTPMIPTPLCDAIDVEEEKERLRQLELEKESLSDNMSISIPATAATSSIPNKLPSPIGSPTNSRKGEVSSPKSIASKQSKK